MFRQLKSKDRQCDDYNAPIISMHTGEPNIERGRKKVAIGWVNAILLQPTEAQSGFGVFQRSAPTLVLCLSSSTIAARNHPRLMSRMIHSTIILPVRLAGCNASTGPTLDGYL